MSSNLHISNIIFDLGNVIINIDPPRTVAAFAAYHPEQEAHISHSLLNTELFYEFEKGTLSVGAFKEGMRTLLKKELSDEQIVDAWNLLLLDIPKERIDLLKNLKNKYRTFILSNTNVLHVAHIEQNYPLAEWVEKVYYSCDMGKRKPQVDIYEQVLSENNLSPKNTLFIDDNLDNIATAEALRLPSLHIEVGKTNLLDFFDEESLEVKVPSNFSSQK